ncbi:Uncharacterized protein HZ326_16299 [Fusarium oxysporum f. sp. albedinis]|nr:Uncharacterized protein HZ326_16299 [Fusarium oxysporum f. sp. albedinis]
MKSAPEGRHRVVNRMSPWHGKAPGFFSTKYLLPWIHRHTSRWPSSVNYLHHAAAIYIESPPIAKAIFHSNDTQHVYPMVDFVSA